MCFSLVNSKADIEVKHALRSYLTLGGHLRNKGTKKSVLMGN